MLNMRSWQKVGLFLVTLGMLLSVAGPASAQEPINVWVGYQYLYVSGEEGEDGTSVPLGFDAGVGFPLNISNLKVIADLNWSRKSEEEFGFETTNSALAFGGGVQWASTSNPSYTPFVNVLLGIQRDAFSASFGGEEFDESESNFFFQPGAGVRFPVGTMNAFVNGNYRRVFYEGEGENFFTLVVGLQFDIMR
jgi:hypothetical protein